MIGTEEEKAVAMALCRALGVTVTKYLPDPGLTEWVKLVAPVGQEFGLHPPSKLRSSCSWNGVMQEVRSLRTYDKQAQFVYDFFYNTP